MYDQYSNMPDHLEKQFNSYLQRMLGMALAINQELYPVSPFSIIRLLDEALGNQRLDVLVISREKYYNAVLTNIIQIKSECYEELDKYARTYIRQSRARYLLKLLNWFLSITSAASYIVGVYALMPLLILFFSNKSILLLSEEKQHGIIIPIVTIIVIPITIDIISALIRYRIDRIYRKVRPAAQALDRRLEHQFHSIAIDLMRTNRDRRFDPLLRSDRAPTLVEMESARILPSDTFDRVIAFLRFHVTSTVGIAGRRGAGKSTLLRWLVYTLEPEWITVYLPAPAAYNTVDFVRMIFRATVNAILSTYQVKEISARSRFASAFLAAFRPRQASQEIARLSDDMLNLIGWSRSDQWTSTGGLSAKGASVQRQKQVTMTAREPTHPELISAFTKYLESYRRLGGRTVAIIIDELDKLSSPDDAIAAINSLKDLFHLPSTHLVVSVSEDALVRFVMRGIPFRDVFDSAFDDIMRVEPPTPEDAWKLLAHRTGGFPISVALFCYAWSGGLPRDLIRTARSCVDVRRSFGEPATVATLVPPVVRDDMIHTIDAVLTTTFEKDIPAEVDSVLALRRKIQDKTVPLDDILETARLRQEFTENDNEMFQRIFLYIDLGCAVVRYFGTDFNRELETDFEQAIAVVRKLAQAKLALATYPSEAAWLLSEALRAIKRK